MDGGAAAGIVIPMFGIRDYHRDCSPCCIRCRFAHWFGRGGGNRAGGRGGCEPRHRSGRRRNTFYRRLITVTFRAAGLLSAYFIVFVIVLVSSFTGVIEGANHKILQLTASMMERELEMLNDLSWKIAIQPEIQENLEILNDPESPADWALSFGDITSALVNHVPSNRYLASIRILDTRGDEFMAGRDPYPLSEAHKEILNRHSRAEKGARVYTGPGEINDYLIIHRQIRRLEDFSLEHLGVIALFIDMPEMIRGYEGLVEEFQIDLRIFSEGRAVDGKAPMENPIPRLEGHRGSRPSFGGSSEESFRLTMGKSRYIAAVSRSTRSDWLYLSTVPVTAVYSRISGMIVVGFIIYVTLTAAVVYTAMEIDKKLSIPIAELSRRLVKVESGDFNIELSPEKLENPTDEIRRLYSDLDICFRKIGELIAEDYLKRIELQDARIRILQSQINPHFLYNTLDTVLWMAKAGETESIAGMIKSLGRLLRKSLSSKSGLIPCRDELELLNDYLVIQRYRFGERLQVRIDSSPAAASRLIPPFTFQPIVENSIRYALEEGSGRCTVIISLEFREDRLRCYIADDGPGFTPKQIQDFNRGGELEYRGCGIGIMNVRDRLERLLTGVDFRIGRGEDGGARVWFSC